MSVEIPTASQQEINAKYEDIKKADLKQKAQQTVVENAQVAQTAINDAANMLKVPVVEALKMLKKITADLNAVLDSNVTWAMVKQTFMANAGALQASVAGMTAAQIAPIVSQFAGVEQSEDSSIVQDVAGPLLQSTIKAGFDAIKAPVSTLESIIPIAPVTAQLNAVTSALDGLVAIALIDIPDAALDTMLAMKTGTDAYIKQQVDVLKNAPEQLTDTAKQEYTKTKAGIKDAIGTANDKAKEVAGNVATSAKAVAAGLGEGVTQSWKDFKCPEMPPGVQTTLDDFIEAVQQVCKNIQNVAMVVLFKLIGCIFDCLNQIVGVIGVPTFPDPLSKIMELIPSAVQIFTFISTMPMSLTKLGKAIVKKKVKELSIIQDQPAAIQPMKMEAEVQEEGKRSCGGGGGSKREGEGEFTVNFFVGSKRVFTCKCYAGDSVSDPRNAACVFAQYRNVEWDHSLENIQASIDIHAKDGWYYYEPGYDEKTEQNTYTVNGVTMNQEQFDVYEATHINNK